MLVQVMQMTAVGLVMRYFAIFSASPLVPKDVSDFATSFSLSISVPKGQTLYICVWLGYLQTWMLTLQINMAPYATITEAEPPQEEQRNLKSYRDL